MSFLFSESINISALDITMTSLLIEIMKS